MNMGSRRSTVLTAALVGTAAVAACAVASPGSRLWLVHGPGRPVSGRAASIVVGGNGARRKVKVWIALGSVRRSFTARTQSHDRYRARVVFPTAGRWTFGARMPGIRVRLGSVRVRPRAIPLTFTWPTSVDVEPDGSLLLAEGGDQTGHGRVLRIDPATGKTSVVARADEAYAVVHGPSGAVYLSAGHLLLRLDGRGGTTPVAQADGDIGPVAVAANGSGPHGLAVTNDGGLLVSDTGHGRVIRIDLKTGVAETWGQISEPRGMQIARDGTVYLVDASTHRVSHLMADGRPLASLPHVFYDPYDVAVAADGSVYVVDTAVSGRLYRVSPSGKTTVVSRFR
jgi:DNA-binding beta-propeller fold protein YncE